MTAKEIIDKKEVLRVLKILVRLNEKRIATPFSWSIMPIDTMNELKEEIKEYEAEIKNDIHEKLTK